MTVIAAVLALPAPLFAFWLLVMVSIWLFLLGVARIVTGTFTPAEVVLTIVIATSSALGLATAYRRQRVVSGVGGLCAIAVFAAAQFVAFWLSTRIRA